MKKNIFLVVVDCLRFDFVTRERMPWLYEWGQKNIFFARHWSESHCTDPAITTILSGKHPDRLRLYSMLQEHPQFQIPERVEMLAQIARAEGYHTAMVSNLGRWYRRGVKKYINTRGMTDQESAYICKNIIVDLPEPWFLVWHTVGMHRPYMGGSYIAAAGIEDEIVSKVIGACNEKDTSILVTSDHGEGLGEKGIDQHGYGLWDFLTHVPLIIHHVPSGDTPTWIEGLTSHYSTYEIMHGLVTGGLAGWSERDYIFQAGDTPPDIRHRGVVAENGDHLIREARGGVSLSLTEPEEIDDERWRTLENALVAHCLCYGIDYWDETVDREVVMRLKGLGYYD